MSEPMPLGHAAPAFEAASLDITIQHVARVLRRNKILFLGSFLGVLLAGFAVLAAVRPGYTAMTTVAIAAPQPSPLAAGMAPAADPAQDEDWPLTVATMIQSREVAAAVLQDIPPPAPSPGLRAWLCHAGLGLLCPRQMSEAAARDAEIDAFLQNLAVTPEPHAQVIDIAVTADDPQRAAALANAVVTSYQQIALAQEAAKASHAAAWLASQTEALRQSWIAADEAANAFSASHHLTIADDGSTRGPLIDQQIGAAAAALAAAQSQLDAAQAQADTPHHGTAAALASQPVAVAAASTLIALENARDQLAVEFGPNYPKIQALNQQIATTQAALNGQSGNALASVREDAGAARRQVQALTAQLNALRAEAEAEGPADAEYAALSTRADSLRSSYQAFQTQAASVMDAAALAQPPVSVISPAEPPRAPAYPNKLKFSIGIIFLAFVASAAGLVVKDGGSPGFGQANDLRASLQLPLLATLPAVTEKSGAIAHHVIDKPYSRTSEAVRGIAATLALLAGDQPGPRSVLITSAGALEGKSTLAIWLATVVRHTGQRVLLIDGDHRRGTLMQGAGAKDTPGLTDLLAGQAALEEVVQIDPTTGVAFIAAGTATARSFGSGDLETLRGLMSYLKKTYSLIVIDSPPLLAMVDALVLGRIADQTVFVCRWHHSSRQAIVASLDRLRTYGTRVTGIVVSMVEQDAALDFNGEYSLREFKLINQLYGS